jgi:hypothetical protein
MGKSGLKSSGSGVGSVMGYSEPRHQPSGSTQHEEFLDQLGNYSRAPLIRTLVIRIGLALIENSKQRTSLERTVYRIEYSTVLWLLELQIRSGRNV